MYLHSASLYDVMHPTQDYHAAATELRRLIDRHCPDARSLLDVACGTGRHLVLLRDDYEVEGVDISADMLAVARRRCPQVTLHEADMRTFALGRRFDVVACLFSSIGYVASFDELVTTVANLRDHTTSGGLIVLEPWLAPERYRVGEVTAGHAETDDTKVAWMYTADLVDGRSVFDIHHLVGSSDGVDHFVERHSLALFTRGQYEDAFRAADLEPAWDDSGFFGYGLLTATAS